MANFPAEETISTLAEFVEFLADKCDGRNRIYRGQRVDKELTPKIARITPQKDSLTAESRMFSDFRRQVVPYLEFGERGDLELLALAQHHGMATRLLDWSENPFVALWFAVEREAEKGKNGVIWILKTAAKMFADDKPKFDPFKIQRTILYRPKHIARRITAQFGCFSVHHHTEEKGYVPLDKDAEYQRALIKVTIPGGQFGLLRKELDRVGFNAASIFPDINGLCRHIQWQHSLERDENWGALADLGIVLPPRLNLTR